MSLQILHVVQILSVGGAGRALVAMASRDAATTGNAHRVVSLLPPDPRATALCEARGIAVEGPCPDPRDRMEGADIVVLHWWNCPETARLLRMELPPCRLAAWFHVGGMSAPQVVDEALVRHVDFAAACSPGTWNSPGFRAASDLAREGRAAMLFAASETERFLTLDKKPHEGFRVGYVGTVDPVKMHPLYVDMSHAVRGNDVRFVVCGGPLQEQLARTAANLGDGRFEFMGHIDDISRQLSTMDVFGYPLCEDTYAGSELALQEAMAAGVPPVVFPHGGLSELVADGVDGLVVRDAESYREAIERLHADRSLLARLSDGARRKAREMFLPAPWAAKWSEVFRKLSTEPKRPRGPLHPELASASWGEWLARSFCAHSSPFLASLHPGDLASVMEAESRISASSPLLRSEHSGGLKGWSKSFPDDPHLRLWSALASEGAGLLDRALEDYAGAFQSGLQHWRVLWYGARTLAKAGQKEEAAAICQRILTEIDHPLVHALAKEILAPTAPPPTIVGRKRSARGIHPEEFERYSYSRSNHVADFGSFPGIPAIDPENSDLKAYQDHMVLAFLRDNIPPGSRILEIGGGASRVLAHVADRYECWNLEPFEGVGNGPTSALGQPGVRLVRDYLGNRNPLLPEGAFDFVFSISALEHVPDSEEKWIGILDDLDRLMAPGAWSLHCLDCVARRTNSGWTSGFAPWLSRKTRCFSRWSDPRIVAKDPELHYLRRGGYERHWMPATKRPWDPDSMAYSANILWRKTAPSGKLPRISMVVPSFNQAKFLEDTLRSILDQGYPDLQLVVMDGGSTDGSTRILEDYSDRLHFWRSSPDGGQYKAIEEGFRHCDGEIFGWLNSDDLLHPFSLWKVARAFMQHPEADWITGRPSAWDEHGNLVDILELPSWDRERFLKGDYRWLQQESTFWRADLWRKTGAALHPDLRLAGDFELWLRFFRQTRLFAVDALIGGFRRHPDQKTARWMDKYLVEAEAALASERRRSDTWFVPNAPEPILLENANAPQLLGKGYRKRLPGGFAAGTPTWLRETGMEHETEILEETIRKTYPEEIPATPRPEGRIPLVSAVVSTYKSERYIRACLEDLVGQTLFERGELEIVVVDAASPEAEWRVVEEFRSRHPSIVYLRAPERESLYASWNRGIRASRGRFVTNANTDDSHRRDAMELLARALEESPEADVAFADCIWTDTPNDKWDREGSDRKRVFYPDYHPASALHWCTLGPHPMWRRELFDRIGWFDPEWRSAGDLEFMIRFAAAGRKALHVPEALSLFYQNREGLSQSGSEGSREEQDVFRHWWPRFPIERAYKVDTRNPEAAADAWTALGIRALRCGAPWAPEHAFPEHALHCFLKAIELHPSSAHATHFLSELAKAIGRQDLLPRRLQEDLLAGRTQPRPATPLAEPPPAVPSLSWRPSHAPCPASSLTGSRTTLGSETPVLHAFAPVFNFTGYARLDREAFLAAESAGLIQLSLDPSVNNAEFIKGVEAQGEAATAPWNRIFSRKPDHSGFCLISDLPCNFAKLRAARPAFAGYAGLTMFETDRLPAGWKDDCLGVDEIWVPSSFNLRSFAAAGVPERMLKRIPCGIDMDRFRPGAAVPLRVEGRRRTNFLSVFEWTPRKGWDALLLGWAKAFSRDDDASLTLKAYIADSRPGELTAKIESFYRSRGIDSASLAPIIVVDGFLPEAAMPGLYASADVFALPSRGEGWGLPYLEAMACGVPVIATGWSAHLDFVTSENGYLVDHELVPVSKEQTTLSSYYGADHRWADPSVEHLADLLRRCHRDRNEVRAKGARARIEVQETYSSQRTAEWIAGQVRGNGARRPTATASGSMKLPVASSRPRIGFDARTLSVADSIVRGIGNYAWHHLLAILETRPGCDITILHDDATQPPTEIVERTKALGAKWAPWSDRTSADFDIFHTPDPMHVYPGYASPFQRFGSTRVTATFHDIIPIRMYEGRIANWPGYLARLDELKERGATLLCNSEFTRTDLLAATSIDPRKAIAVMAGFNASGSGKKSSKQESDALLRRLRIDKPFFLHVGAADPHKNFESALAACQAIGKSRPVQFVVAGKLANALGAMRDQIAQAGLKDVVFTDYLTREELELLYSRAVATLFLSRYEGFGFPALEAMACGCPVIASNAASIPEVVGDAALIHAPDDLPAIAASMLRLLDTPSLRDDLVRRGKDRATRFDWKDVARRTWEAWDRLMGEPAPKPVPPPAPARTQWISPVWDPSGYGDESRAFIKHLASTDLGVGVLAWGRHSESFRQSATPGDRKLLDSLMGRELVPGRPVILDIPASSLGRVSDGGVHVGRTTFETDGLPADWVARCNTMDEIWVPCRFNKETFSKAGVTKPILVVGEGVDTNKFRPDLEPLALPGIRKGTTYLSIFEWTHRKGPDLLLRAWAQAFSASDDVELVLRCYPPNQVEGDPLDWIEKKIDEELSRAGSSRSRCAPIVIVSKQVPDADMPRLYAAADVYVAPSRGEGWGRPHMEAMSCGVPVIATRWSGNLEFQNDDNSWLIDIEGLEEIDAREEYPFYRGQKWARPSVRHLVELLRKACSDTTGRRRLGYVARCDMLEHWDWSKIAPLAEIRLREILNGIPCERSALNQIPASRIEPSAGAMHPSIRWVGPVFNFSGYARLARETLKGLMDQGVAASCDPQLNDKEFFASLSHQPAEASRWRELLSRAPEPGTLVLCDMPRDANGVDILGAHQRNNPGCAKRVCWTMFESDRLPEGWAGALNTMDEVWVPSEFNRRTFAEHGVIASKIHVIPVGIDARPYASASPMQLPGTGYTFLSVFQWMERKGYDVLLDSWAKAFRASDPVRLVLRSHSFGSSLPVARQLEAFLASRGLHRDDLAPIHLIEEFLPDDRLPELFAAIDCFVLPSRGEGWCIPCMEAMAAAKPVIATAWSAQTDYLDQDNSWLLDPRRTVAIGASARKENPYLEPDHQWADPDPDQLASLLRYAFEHPEEGRAKGRKGAHDVRTKWTPERTATAIAGRLAGRDATDPTLGRNPTKPEIRTKATPEKVSINLARVAEGIKQSRSSERMVATPRPETTNHRLSIRWEGSQFVHHSLAHVNREFCLELSRRGHDLSLVPFEPDTFDPASEPRLAPLAKLVGAPLSGPCNVHVRHQWPPDLSAPKEGRWLVIQPWEFGSPPADWMPVFTHQIDELWAYTSHVRDMYLEAGVPPEIVKVVPLGVDTEHFHPNAPRRALRTRKSFKFLFVGGTIARKGFDILLNAWKEAFGPDDDVCLVVKDMGGNSFYKGQTGADWVRDMQASGRCAEIEFIDDELPPSQMPGLYTACDVLVHPYRGEGFGLPIAEAMSCGVPCIVTRGGAADDFCSDVESWGITAKRMPVPGGKVGPFETVSAPWWLEPSLPDLVDKLRQAKIDHEARRSKADAARKRIVDGFTWDKATTIAQERLLVLASRPIRRSTSTPRFVSALDKLSLRITNPKGKLAPEQSPALPGTGTSDGEIDLAELNRLLVRAEAAAARGELGEAEHLTENAVARFPHQNLAWLARAMVLRGLGKFRKASEAIDRAIKERETPEALLESLQIHLLAGEAAPARKVEKTLKERHAAWFKEMRELFRARGQTWPPDLLKPARPANKQAPPARKGKR